MKLAVTATPEEARLAPVLLRGPLSESFALASRYGCDGIEVHLRNPHDLDWQEIVGLSRRYSLPVTTLGTGMAAGMDGLTFTDAKNEVRSQAAKRREFHFACLQQCCRAAADAGVSLLLEPLNRYESDWFNTSEDALGVIAQLGAASLKYLADTFHMNIEEVDVAASIRRAGNLLGYVHLVDSNRRGPGQGHLSFEEVLKALIDVGYDGYLSLECLPKPDAESAIKNSLKYIRKILAKLNR
jgi:sugar phosphate isomerase/epimerase